MENIWSMIIRLKSVCLFQCDYSTGRAKNTSRPTRLHLPQGLFGGIEVGEGVSCPGAIFERGWGKLLGFLYALRSSFVLRTTSTTREPNIAWNDVVVLLWYVFLAQASLYSSNQDLTCISDKKVRSTTSRIFPECIDRSARTYIRHSWGHG